MDSYLEDKKRYEHFDSEMLDGLDEILEENEPAVVDAYRLGGPVIDRRRDGALQINNPIAKNYEA